MIYRIIAFALLLGSCVNAQEPSNMKGTDKGMHKYWYGGEAEISSYKLEQARYGELREGTSVLVFVTEPFSAKDLVKSDYASDDDVPVLKLNRTKNFITGVYPYSMMTSTFMPFDNPEHSLKISSSSQEWCGHTYMELENRKGFTINTRSYFQGESGERKMPSSLLEDDIWTQIRLKPNDLPTGKIKMLPSFFFMRMMHIDVKAYECMASLEKSDSNTWVYKLDYPELDRDLEIHFSSNFPYKIQSWNETFKDGFGPNKKVLTTKATLINSIMSPYWSKHSNADLGLRKELGLD